MRVVITGSSGLVGTAFVRALRARGDTVLRLVRRQPRLPDELAWDPDAGQIDPGAFEGADAVVHLAGAGVGTHRWSPAYKEEILRSRVDGTRLVARAVSASRVPVFLSASAIGYYGNRGNEILTEASPPGTGFRADVCRRWEEAALQAGSVARVVLLRSGIVLSRAGGLLPLLSMPFKLGLGGPLGSGRQFVSWISLDDQVGAILHLLSSDVAGPVNLCSPSPVASREFARSLGRVLGRPSKVALPAAVLEILAGRERVREVVLSSQAAMPQVLLADRYRFVHPTLEMALAAGLDRHEPTA